MLGKAVVMVIGLVILYALIAPDLFGPTVNIREERQLLIQLSIRNSSCCQPPRPIVFPHNSGLILLRRICSLLPSHLLCLAKCRQMSVTQGEQIDLWIRDRSLFLDHFCPLIGPDQVNSTLLLAQFDPNLIRSSAHPFRPVVQIDTVDRSDSPRMLFAQLEQIFGNISKRLEQALPISSFEAKHASTSGDGVNTNFKSKKSVSESDDLFDNEIPDGFDLVYENRPKQPSTSLTSSFSQSKSDGQKPELLYTCMKAALNISHLSRLHHDPAIFVYEIDAEMRLKPSKIEPSTESTSSVSPKVETTVTFDSKTATESEDTNALNDGANDDDQMAVMDDFEGRQMGTTNLDPSCEANKVVLVISTLLLDNIQLRNLLTKSVIEGKSSILNGMIATSVTTGNTSLVQFMRAQVSFHHRLTELCDLLQKHEDTLVGIMDRCGNLMQFSSNLRLMIQESLQQLLNSRAGCDHSNLNRLLTEARSLERVVNHVSNRLRAHPNVIAQFFTCINWRLLGTCDLFSAHFNNGSSHRVDEFAHILLLRNCAEQSIQNSVIEEARCQSVGQPSTIIKFAQLIANEMYVDSLDRTLREEEPSPVFWPGQSKMIQEHSSVMNVSQSGAKMLGRSVLMYTIDRIEDFDCADQSFDLLLFCAQSYSDSAFREMQSMNRSIDLNRSPIESSFETADRSRRIIKRLCW